MFSRPRFTECEDKTRQGNSLQQHVIAIFFIFFGYDLADDQRQGKAFGFFEPDAEVISWSILPQVGHVVALDKHWKLPGYFSKGENKHNTSTIKFEACLLIIHELISRLSRIEERWMNKVALHCGCLD
jgi:hypothetical protein